jgi:uncharacterized protein (DUF58 family)
MENTIERPANSKGVEAIPDSLRFEQSPAHATKSARHLLMKAARASFEALRRASTNFVSFCRVTSSFIRDNRWVLFTVGILLIPAWVKGINLLLLLALLVVSMWAVNLWIAGRQLRRIRAHRRWIGPIFAGREARWEIELQTTNGRSASGFRVIDAGPDHRREWFVDRIEASQSMRLAASTMLPRRGLYRLNPLGAASMHPFGLGRRKRRIGQREQCVVLPQLGFLNATRFDHWLSQRVRGDGRIHRTARPSMMHQDDLHGLRPFRAGDNPRWIHWRTSARKNQKMVREFEQDTGQELILLVEPHSANPGQYDPILETVISLAATICWEWHRIGNDKLSLGILGSKPVVAMRHAGADSALEMLRHLALTEGEAWLDPGSLLKRLATPVKSSTPVLLVASQQNTPVAGRLSKVLNRPIFVLTPELARDFYEAPALAVVRN